MFHRFLNPSLKTKGPLPFVVRGIENAVGLYRYVEWVKPDLAYEVDVCWRRKQLGRVDLVLVGSTADL